MSDAVDAGYEIEKRADERREHDDPGPANRGPDVLFGLAAWAAATEPRIIDRTASRCGQ